MNISEIEFPLYISFDPIQLTLFNTTPNPTMRLAYLERTHPGPKEAIHDLLLPLDTLSQFINFFERLPAMNYSGKLLLPKGDMTLKFIKRTPSKNPYLDLVHGRLYKKNLFFNVPVTSFTVRVKSLETLLVALRGLSLAV